LLIVPDCQGDLQNLKHSYVSLNGKPNPRLDALVHVLIRYLDHLADKKALDEEFNTRLSTREQKNHKRHQEAFDRFVASKNPDKFSCF